MFTLSGGTWSQSAELTASDGAANDGFGAEVVLSGTTVVVGASDHAVDGNADQGAAYVFNQSGGTWSQTAELTASNGAADDYFGQAEALSGSTIIEGDPSHDTDQGAAYIYSPNVVQPQGTEPGPGGVAASAVGYDGQGGGSPSEAAPVCHCKDPVDLATGDLAETATDLTLPGAGLPVEFTRTFDAQSAQEEVAGGTPPPPLGYGWSYNLGMTLTATASTATVTEENGPRSPLRPMSRAPRPHGAPQPLIIVRRHRESRPP